MPNIIGIDLGTTNSAVAIFRHGQAEVLKNLAGETLTPSCVSYMKNSECVLVGTPAVEQKTTSNCENTIYDIKRLIGMDCNNVDVLNFKIKAPFKLINVDGKPMLEITHNNKTVRKRPIEISAKILISLRETAERLLNGNSSIPQVPITQAVITVPAYFSQIQKKETLEAAKLAGLNDVKLMTESAAVAYAYGFDRCELRKKENYRMLVYDFGGGTFDVSILEVNDGFFKHFAIDGDIQLGGRNIDLLLREYAAKEIKQRHHKDLLVDKRKSQKLLQMCEQWKRELANAETAEMFLGNELNIEDTLILNRKQFDELCRPLIMRSIAIVKRALENAKISAAQINEVLMVGGTSKIPLVSTLLVQLGFCPSILNFSISAEEAVVKGASIRAAQLAKNLNISINMSEVIPLSIGLDIDDDVFVPMICRNTQIPQRITKVFETAKNNQQQMDFQVFEGERKIASKNNFLGEFSIKLEKMGVAGSVKAEITMEVDENGLLHVHHKHNRKTVTVDMNFGPRKNTEREVEKVLEGEKQFKSEDLIEKRRLTAKFDLQVLIEEEKHKAKTFETLRVCKEYERWMISNSDTSGQMFKRKRSEFVKEIAAKKLRH